ncbi:MAG: class I SAM-dependent methyltransferase [Desulfobacteraceae bacterium]
MKSSESTCPVCNSSDISIFFEINQVPIHCCILWPTAAEARSAPRGDIRLGFCRDCGHIFNIAFNPKYMQYNQEYENSLHFSACFRDYAQSLAQRLIDRYDLHGKDIIEIGCGQGDFLVLLCRLGGNRGLGFDPSYTPERHANNSLEQVTFIQDFYSRQYANYKADFVCCRHLLEHIQDPVNFLLNLEHTIRDQNGTMVFFEVPNVMFTLRDSGIWDLIYEHCSYFSSSSLARAFTSAGFKVLSVTDAYEGQFLLIEALAGKSGAASESDPEPNLESLASYVAAFAERYQDELERWRHKIDEAEKAGKKVVVWGAGSKGVTFLNNLKVQNQIDYIIDINPYKQGKYVPVTGQKVMAPEFLREYCPDLVIVMNPIYLNEIQGTINHMNITTNVLAVN